MSAFRVLRGGSYGDDSWRLRATNRDWLGPVRRSGSVGFRIVVVFKGRTQ